MEFEIIFKIDPASAFGLPENDITVVPTKEGNQIHGPALHRKSGKHVGVGTLSDYRKDENALKVSLDLDNTTLRFEDNTVFITIEAENSTSAFQQSTNVLEDFLRHLTLETGRVFEYECLIIQDRDDNIYNVPEIIQHFKMSSYNISELKKSVLNAGKFYEYKNEKLIRSLQYYKHALLLFDKRNQITDLLSRHYTQLLSSVFLNLWKAASVIVGDPSVDKDYQKRYKNLGFDYNYFESRIEFLRGLRNDFDVAHYSLDESSNKEVEKNFRKAVRIVSEILKKYRDTL